MTCQIAIVAEADRQLHRIEEWWQTNRGGTPDLFLDEFQHALDLLSELPDIGATYQRFSHPLAHPDREPAARGGTLRLPHPGAAQQPGGASQELRPHGGPRRLQSNWSRRPLAAEQLRYAALDAEVLVALYRHFEIVEAAMKER